MPDEPKCLMCKFARKHTDVVQRFMQIDNPLTGKPWEGTGGYQDFHAAVLYCHWMPVPIVVRSDAFCEQWVQSDEAPEADQGSYGPVTHSVRATPPLLGEVPGESEGYQDICRTYTPNERQLDCRIDCQTVPGEARCTMTDEPITEGSPRQAGRDITIGIDPGLRGGLARIEHLSAIEIVPMPIIPAKTKKGPDGKVKKISRDQYDLTEIRDLLIRWKRSAAVGIDWEYKLIVFIEEPIPFPAKLKRGSLAQFQRGVSRGWAWMLTALEIPHMLIHPRTWQAAMHKGLPGKDTKAKSILAASRLFPSVSLRRSERSRIADDGIAEALLIAEFGRRLRFKP